MKTFREINRACISNGYTDFDKVNNQRVYRILKEESKGRIIISDLVTNKEVDGESS